MKRKKRQSQNMLKIKCERDDSAVPGISFEKVVARIQQKMDPNSTVTHNAVLYDRVGNKRQCDVVIRGQFGGRPVLGVMECKDHGRKISPEAVDAFAKKTENLGANLRILISKRGFTKQALKLAKHENIGCLSLLPNDPVQAGFSIGDMWYGVIRIWENVRLRLNFSTLPAPTKIFNPNTVKWKGKPVGLWFLRELFTAHDEETTEGEYILEVISDQLQNIEVEGKEYSVRSISCDATRVCRKKKKWMCWSGDAFWDWHSGKFTVPPGGTLVGSAVDTDLSTWSDYDGEIPNIGEGTSIGLIQGVLHLSQKWDKSLDSEVPDLRSIGTADFALKSAKTYCRDVPGL